MSFGVGIAVLGYCPGTGVAACGEGRKDAVLGVIGMVFGSGIYIVAYSPLKDLIAWFGSAGKITLPEMTGTNPWLWIIGLVVIAVVACFVDMKNRQSTLSAEGYKDRHVAG